VEELFEVIEGQDVRFTEVGYGELSLDCDGGFDTGPRSMSQAPPGLLDTDILGCTMGGRTKGVGAHSVPKCNIRQMARSFYKPESLGIKKKACLTIMRIISISSVIFTPMTIEFIHTQTSSQAYLYQNYAPSEIRASAKSMTGKLQISFRSTIWFPCYITGYSVHFNGDILM
jgi:hypothetical protein